MRLKVSGKLRAKFPRCGREKCLRLRDQEMNPLILHLFDCKDYGQR